jgi:hypothetical protein
LNFTMTPAASQGSRLRATLGVAATLWLAACGGARANLPAPVSPEAAVRSFLNAVKANSLSAMGETWGSARGPAVGYMDQAELEQRLTVIRSFLEHESFEILGSPPEVVPERQSKRVLQVRLIRKGCQPVVPFTVIPYGGGWLVTDIDLTAAGNPRRPCPPESGAGT